MKSRQPALSVVVPVFNGEEFLAEAVQCIRHQDYEPLEIVVVDDGSTDGTAAVAAGLQGIRYLRQDNAGPAAARNRGLQMAQGELVTFQDVDDLWPDGKVRRQVDCLVEKPELEIVLGRTQYMRCRKGPAGERQLEPFGPPCVSFSFGAATFRRSVFGKVGLLDTGMRYSEDTDWFLRARELEVPMLILDEVALYYRRHEQNMTLDRQTSEINFTRALKKSLDRRRQQEGAAASLPEMVHSAKPAPAEESAAKVRKETSHE